MKTYRLGEKLIQAEEWRYEAQFKAMGYIPLEPEKEKVEEPKEVKVEKKTSKKTK